MRPGYSAINKKSAAFLDQSLLSRFLRCEEHARDNLPGVLRRIDELEAMVHCLSSPTSSADRLTPRLAAASPAQFEALWKKVKIVITNQETAHNDLKRWTQWAQAQIFQLDNNITAVDKDVVKVEDNDKFKNKIGNKLESLLKQLKQLKQNEENTNKDTTDFKNEITRKIESIRAIASKPKDESQASAKNEEVQELKGKLEEHKEYIANQGARLKKLVEQSDAQAALIAKKDKEIADLNAGQARQDAEIENLKRLVMGIAAHAGFQTNSQQFPGPGPDASQQQQQQQQPQPGPSGQAPGPQGNGTWTPSPSPPGQDSQPAGDVDMEGVDNMDLDSPMTDAPAEPAQTQRSQQPQPLHPQLPQPPSHQPNFAQQPPQPIIAAPEDTPMGNDGPVASSNNGFGGITPPTAPPAQPSAFQSGTPTAPPSQPSDFNSGMPTAPTAQPSIFQSGMPNANPNSFSFKGTAPAVNKPQINWGATMETLSFDPPPELADDDERPSTSSAKMPPAKAASPSPPVNQSAPTIAAPFNSPTTQPAAQAKSSTNTGDSPATKVNNGSASNTDPIPVANNGVPSSSPTVGTHSAADKATPKAKPAQKKKASLFVQRKPAANPSKPASVTSKAQSTQTTAASWAQKRQAAFRAGQLPEPEHTPSPAPKAPTATMRPADDESADWIRELEGKPNPSPFAAKPKPAAKPSAYPYGSSPSATHDTVESADPGNIFLKDIVEEPKEEPEPKPEAKKPTHAHEPEVNPRKHTGNYRAPTVEDEDEDDATMDGGRPTLRPKGRAHKISADRAKAIIEEQAVEQAFGMWDMAMAASKAAAAAQAPKPPSPDGEGRTSKMTGGQVRDHNGVPDRNVSDDAVNREHAQKVTRVTRPDEPRLTAKPRSRLARMTPEQLQAHKMKEAKAAAEDAAYQEKVRESERKLKEALARMDDQVDYGDPEDENDEDKVITVMLPYASPPKPTKFSIGIFNQWVAHVRSGTANFVDIPGDEARSEALNVQFRAAVEEQATNDAPLPALLELAGLDQDAGGYTRYEMEQLMDHWCHEVFIRALRTLVSELGDGSPLYPEDFLSKTHDRLLGNGKQWLNTHKADVVYPRK